MQSLKKALPNQNESASGAGALAESGVRAIPPEARAALQAAEAKRARELLEAEKAGDSYQSSVRPSTYEVCPKMLEAHISLVHQVVAPIARRVPANVLRDDLIAAGVFGLVDSLRKNGGDGGATFEWYARTRIRGAVLDELRAQDWLTRRARDAINAAVERDEIETDGISFVGLDELSVLDEQEFLASLDLDPAASYETKETFRHLARGLEELPVRERKVIGMHYFESKTFRDIGIELEISETRAFQLHARAISKLRTFFDKLTRPSQLPPVTRSLTATEPVQDTWDSAFPADEPTPEVA